MSSIFFILVFMSLGLAYIMCQYPYFVCPIEYSQELERMAMSCEPSALFRPQVRVEYNYNGYHKFERVVIVLFVILN